LLLASTSARAVDLPFYSGPLYIITYLLYIVHLTASAGDFYWLLYVPAKARTLKAMVECKLNKGMEVRIYTSELR